jgi:hypothetical protein
MIMAVITTLLSINPKARDYLGDHNVNGRIILKWVLWGGAGNFSLHHRVKNGSGAHPASYPMGARGSFLGGKAAGARS